MPIFLTSWTKHESDKLFIGERILLMTKKQYLFGQVSLSWWLHGAILGDHLPNGEIMCTGHCILRVRKMLIISPSRDAFLAPVEAMARLRQAPVCLFCACFPRCHHLCWKFNGQRLEFGDLFLCHMHFYIKIIQVFHFSWTLLYACLLYINSLHLACSALKGPINIYILWGIWSILVFSKMIDISYSIAGLLSYW